MRAADETAAAQKDDDGLLFHESFLAWTHRPLPSIKVSILSPNMVDVQREPGQHQSRRAEDQPSVGCRPGIGIEGGHQNLRII